MSAMPPETRQEALPTGKVTFAFTDIEGSTKRWERDPPAMQAAVRRHDELMRAVIVSHGGVVFKTIGDAFCAAFARPEDAVAAMLDAQRALAAEDFSSVDGLSVRAAIHTGTADERDGDFFGPALNRVARLLGIGHGGQVLVSGVTTDLVRDALPSHATLRDLGEHRLRDLARPEQVYQLLAPDLPAEFPPLRSISLLLNNLPQQLTSFVGRETEIAEITSLIEKHRLVTLTGSGGVGKTRTSLHVAVNLLDGSADGVWFIELAPLSSGDYIPLTVAQALGVTLPPEGDPLEKLVRALTGKNALLVFDNCEHMVDAAARAISAILRGCPKVKILASSREGLGIDGEETYRMPSLEVPAAISLFVERALSADKKFKFTDENALIIADICRRLDGIPLAIELAASRVTVLSPRQLRERLDERFRVLTGGSRDVLPRQQTLRATIDWSHDLLDERERLLFRRLGFFVNGFTLEGAVAVGGGDDLDEFDVFDVLASLVSKSLVLAEPDGDSLRYRLLESTRAYALEKLDAAGERESAAARHLSYLRDRFVALCERKERTGQNIELAESSATELEDIRFALDGALERSAVVEGAELASSLAWSALSIDSEGIRRSEQYLEALPANESRLRALLSARLAQLLIQVGRGTMSFEIATKAVACARESGETEALTAALVSLSAAAGFLHRFAEAEAALAEAEALPDVSRSLRFVMLSDRARLSALRGDFETAARMNEQLLREARSSGNVRDEQYAALNLAEWEHALGRTQNAAAILQEILPGLRTGKAKALFSNALGNLAGYLVAAGDLPGAVAAAREAIRFEAAQATEHIGIGIAIEHLGLALALLGDLVRAAKYEGYADDLFRRFGFEREFTETTTYKRLTALLRDGVELDELVVLLAEGAALTPEAAIALALED